MRRAVAAAALLVALASCGRGGLVLRARTTRLHPGESIRLSAGEGRVFGWRPVAAESLEWRTTGESVVLVEPDGRVTAIGTRGGSRESAMIGVSRGTHHGALRVFVAPGGPGPSLVITTGAGRQPCTAWPIEPCVILQEGDSLDFRVHDRAGTDVTARDAGTRYFVFVGSGLANDTHPRTVIGDGWPASLDAEAFRIDDRTGTLHAPESIAGMRWFGVTILVRNGDAVGWLSVRVDPGRRARG